jgi:Na+(H+)/acetate symporter ActP
MTPLLAAIDLYILTFSALTVIATIWMGFWSARRSKTAHDFFVAGRSVSVGWNASAISGEYLSAASFMGVAGMVMSSGYDALWYPVGYACGYLFLLLFIAGPLRRFGAYTIPDFAEGRFDSPLFRKIAVVFVLFIGFFYTMPQMKGAGTTLAYIFPGLPYWAGVVLVGAVITLNVALGGMKGITLVQAFQYWLKMFAISVPIFVLMAVYGHYGRQVGANDASASAQAGVETARLLEVVTKGVPTPHSGGMSSSGQSLEKGGYRVFNHGGKPMAKFTLRNGWRYALDILLRREGYGLGMQTPTVDSTAAVSLFASIAAKEIVALESLPDFQVSLTNAWMRRDMLRSIEAQLRTNGLSFAPLGGRRRLVYPSALAAEYEPVIAYLRSPPSPRDEMPAKAPADATWLNPFGPLTSKAAKSEITCDGPLLINPFGSGMENSFQRLVDKMSGGRLLAFNSEQVFTFLPTNHSAFEMVLTSTMERQFTRRISEIRYSPQLTNLFISWPSEFRLIKAKDFSEEIYPVLQSNGVTVIDSGEVVTAFLTKDAKIRAVNPKPYSLLYTYSLIIALVCGTAGLPHILVRFYTNPDGVAAKKTTMWVMILIGVFYLFPPVFGVMGRNLLPELYAGVGAKGTDKVVLELPRILNQQVGKSESGKVGEATANPVSPAHSPTFSPAATIANQRPGGIPWGSILSGITCAGAFAAFMSTFSGLLVSMTGALAHDVYGRMINPKANAYMRLRMFKVCAVLIGGVAILLGMQVEPLQINFMVGQAFAIAAASYFPLLFVSCWWRGITMKGAATGMLTGGICALAAVTLTNFSDLGWLKLAGFWAEHPLLRILCEQPAIWTVPLAIGLMIVVSKLTAREIPSDIRLKMLVLHAPEKLGLKQEYIQEHTATR